MEESEEAGLVAPAVTIEIVQGYDVAPPKEPLTLQQGGKAELVGAFRREPEFAAPVTVAAEYLPAHVTCQPVEVRTASEYRMTCEADASAKPGSYEVQLTPASVVTGLDKREMPYKVAPVTAKLIISENRTQAAR
jgi:hypothetical protein